MTRPLIVVALLFMVSGCDRFRNPKYDKNPWGHPDSEPAPTASSTTNESLPPPPPTGGVFVVATGSNSSSSGQPAGDPTCGGVTYGNESCDACVRENCCAEAITCANDSTCNSLDSCRDACAQDDAECIDECESLYYASTSADRLDSCLQSSCSSACL